MAWKNSAEEAAKAIAEAEKKAHEERMKSIDGLIEKTEQARQASIRESNDRLRAIKEEVDATNELAKKKLEIQKIEAMRRGDAGAAERIQREIGESDANAARTKMAGELDELARKRRDAEAAVDAGWKDWEDAQKVVKAEEDALAKAVRDVREQAEKSALGTAYVAGNGALAYMTASDADRRIAGDRAVEGFMKSDRYKELTGRVDAARAKRLDFEQALDRIEAERDEFDRQQGVLDKRAEALQLDEKAKRMKAEDELKAAREAAERKLEAEREKANLRPPGKSRGMGRQDAAAGLAGMARQRRPPFGVIGGGLGSSLWARAGDWIETRPSMRSGDDW
ncbi:MAG: hypothetical protein ACI4RA_05595 [Kiritimatiellia bacterium]